MTLLGGLVLENKELRNPGAATLSEYFRFERLTTRRGWAAARMQNLVRSNISMPIERDSIPVSRSQARTLRSMRQDIVVENSAATSANSSPLIMVSLKQILQTRSQSIRTIGTTPQLGKSSPGSGYNT